MPDPDRVPPPRRRFAWLGATTVIAVLCGLLGTPSAQAQQVAYPLPAINRVTSAAGFVHPGIAVSASSLERARAQVRQGAEPWASYYAAMIATSYASATFSSKNAGPGTDQPANTAFNSQGVQSLFIDDAFRAYTQAIQYVVTGDPAYRENGLRLVRIWSHMDPAKYAYYPDAHIHSGPPLMRMLAAAEILRYTSVNPGSTGYDLRWNADDTANLATNLVGPMTQTFLYRNRNFMNQHSYSLVGAIAGYIFTDNLPRYREAVEWFSVNATNPDDDTNGALSKVMPVIAADDPRNPYHRTFVQLQEMGRDQAHAWDDVTMLTQLARVVDVQGTRLDPVRGTPSTRRDAVSPYVFGGYRLLRGSEPFFAFMMGKDIPWIDTTQRGGVLSQAYRGRLFDPTNELYHVYKDLLGPAISAVAPSITEFATTQDGGPRFFWGTSAYNYWNSNPDFNPDAWLSFPASAASPPVQQDALVQAETRTVPVTPGTSVRREDERTFVRMKTRATLAVRTLLYADRTGYSPVGVLIRTNGTATLQIRKERTLAPYATVTLPNTHGLWRYIAYDMSTAKLRGSAGGENLAYYTILSSPTVDVDLDAVNLQAKTQLSPPQFQQGDDVHLLAVAGEPLTAPLPATDQDPLTYAAGTTLPTGASLDSGTGTLAWTPTTEQLGRHHVLVVASDAATDAVLRVRLTVSPDRRTAIDAALEGYEPAAEYVEATKNAVEGAKSLAESHVDSADAAAFAKDLAAVQAAVAGLEKLTPAMPDDGSFDYWGRATSAALSQVALGNLLDGDFNTFSGDLRAPAVIDYGTGFRIRSDAFGLQARYNFANRSQGANVYGSNDGRTWTLLTSRETTDTSGNGFALERIPVRAEVKNLSFRFLKLQVDHPGVPTDPAYPGLSSFSEFRIYGERVEMSTALTSVSIASSNSDPKVAQNGDKVTLTLAATEPLSTVTATVEGADAQVERSDATHWTASVTLPDNVAYGRALRFTVDYTTATGHTGATIVDTTDGTALQLWNSAVRTVAVNQSWVTASSPAFPGVGTPEANGWRMFDGDLNTFTDTTSGNGWVTVTPPTGTTLDFDTVRVRPRSNLPARANGTLVQGSADGGATWTTLATITGITDGNQWYAFPLAAPAAQPMLRIYDGHGGFTNLAEVQLLDAP
ncbi:putative Ig domain-containing protein [Kribbella sp. NPDC003557]|uniref:putative Ig domain-containing protein n=1 Tax=Kribbella sp. NPDC003557 TaxID=3154449 RepID=UPI0033B29360